MVSTARHVLDITRVVRIYGVFVMLVISLLNPCLGQPARDLFFMGSVGDLPPTPLLRFFSFSSVVLCFRMCNYSFHV